MSDYDWYVKFGAGAEIKIAKYEVMHGGALAVWIPAQESDEEPTMVIGPGHWLAVERDH